MKAVQEAGRIIQAFNEYNDRCGSKSARRRVYLNKPDVWYAGSRPVLVEPFIDGSYAKFNSNSGGGYDTHYVLTDPAMLSVQRVFGATDGGAPMMQPLGRWRNFFAHHVCNEYCHHSWRRMERPKVVAPVRSGTSFFPKAQRSTAMDAFHNEKFHRF
eukprot:Skav220731  [mRNA]  locus=scaffold2753:236917:238981:- [translate_table: standard]